MKAAFEKVAATGMLENVYNGGNTEVVKLSGTIYVLGYESDEFGIYFNTAEVNKSTGKIKYDTVWYDNATTTIYYEGTIIYKLFRDKPEAASSSSTPAARSNHQHAYEWQILTDPTIDEDGVYAYICSCGDIKEKQPISAAQVFVKDLYGKVKEAPQNGTVTYDAKAWSTISDYLLKKMAERNDVTVTIRFQYQKADYEITFSAGTDYTAVLNDTETMYGFFGIANILGMEVRAL